jgi:hypothetical protein
VLFGKDIAVTCDGFVVADDVRRGRIAVYTAAKIASEVQFAVDVGNLRLQDLFGEEDENMVADMTPIKWRTTMAL